MRWSSLLSILALSSSVAFAAPIASFDDEDKLYVRVKASDVKTSTYRNTALGGNTYTAATSGNNVQKIATPSTPPTGKDADHILEAQTVAAALTKAGHTEASLGTSKWQKIKDHVNSPNNLAFVDSKVNRDKGAVTGAIMKKKPPTKLSKIVTNYMKATKNNGLTTAQKIDKLVPGLGVEKAHKEILKKAGVKRRELLWAENMDDLD